LGGGKGCNTHFNKNTNALVLPLPLCKSQDCISSSESGPSAKLEVFQYGLRGQVGVSSDVAPDGKAKRRAFILGTILHGNEVLVNDTYNPQWNNLQYTQELGLTIYPPYPEASGYAMSADLAAFLSNVGMGVLENLQWKAWSIEDSALGTILAGLSFDMIQMPVEVREHVRVIGKRSIFGASRDSWMSIPFSNP